MAMKVHSAGIHVGQPMQENASGVQVKSESLPAGVMCVAAFSQVSNRRRADSLLVTIPFQRQDTHERAATQSPALE